MRICLPIVGLCAAVLFCGRARAQDTLAGFVLLHSSNSRIETVQPADSVLIIKQISLTGDRRTRKATMLRELDFQVGDVFPFSVLVEKAEQSRRQLMNTNLFRFVTLDIRELASKEVAVSFAVEEKWYFYPQPFVRIANGSFSQWNERGRPLDHLNYGINFTQQNFSGRGDRLNINFAEGYTKRIGFQYQGFFFDRAMKWSGGLSFSYGKNREINYTTQANKLLAVKNPDGFLLESYHGVFELTYRPAIKTRHQFSVGYSLSRVNDTVRKLNENFSPSQNVYSYPFISYSLSFIDYDFNPYPTRGRQGEVGLYKAGINNPVNLWQLSVKGTNYWGIGSKGYFSVKLAGMLKLPFRQPYITQQFMGYGDAFLQGYENYIIDGVAGGYSKQTIGVNLLNTAIPLPTIKWFKSLRSVPLRVYAKAYTNQGYVHHPEPGFNNGLTNRMLYSTGFGVDIVMFTDLLFKFEWSFNQLGQNGVFLHQ